MCRLGSKNCWPWKKRKRPTSSYHCISLIIFRGKIYRYDVYQQFISMQFNFIEYQPTHEQWHDCSTKESNIEIHKIYQAFLIYYIPESNKSGYDPHFSFSRVNLKNLQNFSQSSTFVQWELQASHMASQVALVVKDSPANARDVRDAGLIPGSGRSPGGGHGNPLQYSCLKNPWTEEPARLQSIGSQTEITEAT